MRVLIAVMVVAACVLAPLDAHADAWLSDDFEAYSAGGLAGQGLWTGDTEPVMVESTFTKYGSGKSVLVNCHLWDQSGGASRTVSSGPGYHSIDIDVAMDTEGTAPIGQNLGYVNVWSSAGPEITRIYFANKQFKVLVGPQPGDSQVILDGVVNRQWYHITLGINLAANRLDAWVDGQQKVEGVPLYNTAQSIGSVTLGEWTYFCDMFTKGDIYVDNIVGSLQSILPSGFGSCILAPRFFPGYQQQNVSYPFVLRENSASYKMYYTGTGTCQLNDSAWDQWMTGMVTSTDSITWKFPQDYQPVIYARKFLEGEVADPAALSAEFDSLFAYGACVLKDGATYKSWYTGWNGDTEYSGAISNKVNFRIGYATSSDGVEWTKISGNAGAKSVLGPGPAGQQDIKGVGQPYVLKEGSTYRMWYEGYTGAVWRIFYATSTDGVNWTRHGLALDTTPGSLDALGLRNPVVITRNGKYELWYQGQNPSAPYYHVLRATSLDGGLTWTKAGEVVLHPVSPPKRGWLGEPDWDGSEAASPIHVDSMFVQQDGSCQVFYAKQYRQVWPRAYGSMPERGFHIYTEVVNP